MTKAMVQAQALDELDRETLVCEAHHAHEALARAEIDLGRLHRYGFFTEARNQALLARHDTRYAVELSFGHVEDQQSSGRCWLFAPMVLAKSFALRRGAIDRGDRFSEAYLYFFSLIEKANARLQELMRASARRSPLVEATLRSEVVSAVTGVDDGGEWEWALSLIERYGLVPGRQMPETYDSDHSHVVLDEVHERIGRAAHAMRKAHRRETPAIAARARNDLVRILVAHLGAPPVNVEHGGRAITPLDYARDVIGSRANEWRVVIGNGRLRPSVVYRQRASALGAGRRAARSDLTRLNVSLPRFHELVRRSIELGFAVGFSSDASRNDIDDRTGVMHPDIFDRGKVYGARPPRDLGRREDIFLGVSASDHAMAIVGFDVERRKDLASPLVKMRVANSWGPSHGDHGIFHMYTPWFAENVFKITVHESALTPRERSAYRAPRRLVGEFY